MKINKNGGVLFPIVFGYNLSNFYDFIILIELDNQLKIGEVINEKGIECYLFQIY